MIIDSHQHLGDCRVFDHEVTEEKLIGCLDSNKVDAAVVFPFPGATDEVAVHTSISQLIEKYPGRIIGLISLNPHRSEDAYFNEIERCIKMNFKGIKIHPFGHACPVTAKDADKVFYAAQEYNVPVVIHTGLGVPYTLPSVVIPRARQFPKLKIVLAHSGAYIYSGEAVLVAQECPNVYLETSWCAAYRIREFVKRFGPDRVMFGSDLPENIASELAKYRSVLNEGELAWCLADTAKNVFNI